MFLSASSRFGFAGVMGVFLWLAWPSASFAHTHLTRSEPAAKEVLNQAPSAVRLWFSSPLESAFSKIKVEDNAGHPVSTGDAKVNQDDPKLLEINLSALPAGTYKVTWSVVAMDGHKAKGKFSFTVK